MAASGASDSGSSRCSTPSRANSAWSTTGPAPRMACSPASLSACSPWPPRSGATGRSTPPTSAASSPTTTDPAQLQGIDHLVAELAPHPGWGQRGDVMLGQVIFQGRSEGELTQYPQGAGQGREGNLQGMLLELSRWRRLVGPLSPV